MPYNLIKSITKVITLVITLTNFSTNVILNAHNIKLYIVNNIGERNG